MTVAYRVKEGKRISRKGTYYRHLYHVLPDLRSPTGGLAKGMLVKEE